LLGDGDGRKGGDGDGDGDGDGAEDGKTAGMWTDDDGETLREVQGVSGVCWGEVGRRG
jgi:hypothetical protein